MAGEARRARFESVGYSAADMQTVGVQLIARAIVPRLRAGLTTSDTPAPALSPRYAKQKARKAPPAIRNWTLTGRTLRSMKVTAAGTNRAVIGFSDTVTNRRAFINNRRVEQFGVSPADQKILATTLATLPPHVRAVEA